MKRYYFILFLIFNIHILYADMFSKLKEFREQKIFTDVILVSNDNLEFPCHKNIMAAYSDYFKTMFLNGMKESKQDKIKINYSSEALKIILDFIYAQEKIKLNISSVPLNIYKECLDFANYVMDNKLKALIQKLKIDNLFDVDDSVWETAITYEDENILQQFYSSNNELLDIIQRTNITLQGHIQGVYVASFSPDGTKIVTGS